MDKLRTCFFTGHRIIANRNIDTIRDIVSDNIEEMIIKHNVNTFISGSAIGFDTIAAEEVIKMRKKYPYIKLIMYLPCHGQEKKWTNMQKFKYRMMLSKADDYIYVTEGKYNKNCMKLRNMRMIKDSFFCIAYCLVSRSGTGQTIRNAEADGVKIINIANEIK